VNSAEEGGTLDLQELESWFAPYQRIVKKEIPDIAPGNGDNKLEKRKQTIQEGLVVLAKGGGGTRVNIAKESLKRGKRALTVVRSSPPFCN